MTTGTDVAQEGAFQFHRFNILSSLEPFSIRKRHDGRLSGGVAHTTVFQTRDARRGIESGN